MKDLLENKMFKVFAGVILLVIVIIVVAVIFASGKNKTLTTSELQAAAQSYYQKNPAQLPKENYDSVTIQLHTLVMNGYISSNKTTSCPSYVVVTNMNGTYSYTPFIKCTDDSTNNSTTLMSKLTASMTTSGSGLYNLDGKFIFRGENPNNYVKFADSLWRVIGLDEFNNIKIIYSDIYVNYNEWDDRYNKDVDRDKGINNFLGNEKSRIKEFLDSYFALENNIEKFTAERIARTTKFNTCIDKIDLESNTITCTETHNSRISTLTVSDYINASLDDSCSMSNSINCRNYNYLNLDGWAINAYNGNSYQAYYIDKDEGIYARDAYIRGAIRPVLALRNDVIYISGSGTQLDPYIIG